MSKDNSLNRGSSGIMGMMFFAVEVFFFAMLVYIIPALGGKINKVKIHGYSFPLP
jgi:hypothetical protein